MNSFAAGLLAGLAGTIPMSAVMVGIFSSRPSMQDEPLEPSLVTEGVERKAGIEHRVPEKAHVSATLAAHLAYGAAMGGLYAALRSRLPGPPVVGGMAFGAAVWAASYAGWLPAARILPPAHRRPADRNAMMAASHIVWGGVTGIVAQRIAPRA